MDLKTEVGGVPVAVWGGVIIAGLGVGYFINRRNANKANQPVQLTESGVGAGGSGQFADINPPAPEEPKIETNESWRIKATNGLIATGLYDPATVESALRKYVTGQSVNVVEQAIIAVALTRYGVPPEPLPGPGNQGPVAVTGLSAKANTPPAGRSASVTLNWIPSPGAKSYIVTVSSQYGTTTWDGILAPPYTNLETGADTVQTWTVIAVNDYGQSDPRSVQLTTPPLPANGTKPAPNPSPGPAPAPPPPPQQRTETVRPGDTLTGISLRVYANAGRWREIYNANAGVIEAAARQRGKASSRGGPRNEVGWWIFPGTVLAIP